MNDPKLLTILQKYETLSLAKAIYTITSWPSNRKYIGASDTINKLFISIEESSGTIEIKNYKDFQQLFIIISKELQDYISYPEKFICDTGQVKFYSEEKLYKILIGNGSEDMYEACFLIEEIVSNDVYLKEIWQEILAYEDFVLSEIYTNEYPQTDDFECPSEEYFNILFEKYEQFKNSKLSLFFKDFNSSNEELYEFFTPVNELPIFLPMLKESFLEKLEQILPTRDIKNSVWNATINQFQGNYQLDISDKLESLFDLVFIYPDSDEKFIIENSLALFYQNDLLIFINSELSENLINTSITDFINNKNSILGITPDGRRVSIEYQRGLNLIIQKVEDYDISPNITKVMSFSQDNTYFDIKGLMGIINFASDIEEIIKYLKNKDNSEKIINWSGITSYFQIWQDLDNVIVEGVTTDLVIVPPYQSVEKTVEFFSIDLKNYPFNGGPAFSKVHRWNIISNTKADLSLLGKDKEGSADIFVLHNKKIIYRELHFILDDMNEKTIETIGSFHEIIINGLNENKEEIISSFNKEILEINIISNKILYEYTDNHLILITKYNSKIIIDIKNNMQKLLIKPYWEKILKDNNFSETKNFENDLLLSLLNGVNFSNKEFLELEIKKSDNNRRTSSISQIEVPYYINPHLRFDPPKLSTFKQIRKIMAQIIKDSELEVKDYDESEILGVIKQFRNKIRNDLIHKIESYEKFGLHKKLVNIYSSVIFQIDLHQKRLNEFESANYLEDKYLSQFRGDTINLREESKIYKQVLEYLIEENLVRENHYKSNIPSNSELDKIMAYGKWIIDFQNMSDSVNYGATGWNQLSIREDYVVEIEETSKYIEDANLIRTLRYNYGDYSIRNREYDEEMLLNDISTAFLKDTGIPLQSLFTTLSLLYSNSTISILIKQKDVNVNGNVLEAPIEIVANLFLKETDLPLEDFYKVISFINLEANKITDKNGVIPIWEKKKRENKMSAQPILVNNNLLIFSPITLYELRNSWYKGMNSFILPYNVGLEKLTSSIDRWKTYYERKIVDDLGLMFDSSTYDIYPDKELYKLDPKGNHPRDIGDYDLIAINKKKKEVLLFEVKYMRLSQTMKDFLGDQGKYFLNRKAKAKQFVRRVNYFEENVDETLKNIGLEGKFTVKKYFLTNKNIRSFFREYPFKVISFNEFKKTYFK